MSANENLKKLKQQLNKKMNMDNIFTNKPVNVNKPIFPKKNKPVNVNKPIFPKKNKPVNVNKPDLPKCDKKPNIIIYKNITKTQTSTPCDAPTYNYYRRNLLKTILKIILGILLVGSILFILYLYINNLSIWDIYNRQPEYSLNEMSAPVSEEKEGDMTENKYLTMYGGTDFLKNMKRDSSLLPPTIDPSVKINVSTATPSDNSSVNDINNYINNQNEYIKNINKRVQEINSKRMYSPEYVYEKRLLQGVREVERDLANSVSQNTMNQAYLL